VYHNRGDVLPEKKQEIADFILTAAETCDHAEGFVCLTAFPDCMENKQTSAQAGLQTQVSQSSSPWASHNETKAHNLQ
jgi:uncharacterized protein YggL (DUF469 family)